MKCDNLITYTYEDRRSNVSFDYYEVGPVDKAIEELQGLLHDAEMRADLAEAANTEYRIDIQNLKEKLYEAQQRFSPKIPGYNKGDL